MMISRLDGTPHLPALAAPLVSCGVPMASLLTFSRTNRTLGRVISDSLEKALRYGDRAAECKAMADIAQSREFREHYRAIAQYYMTLAEVEETLAGKPELPMTR